MSFRVKMVSRTAITEKYYFKNLYKNFENLNIYKNFTFTEPGHDIDIVKIDIAIAKIKISLTKKLIKIMTKNIKLMNSKRMTTTLTHT